MHSSNAACVFGEARLISSTSRRFANTGPGRNSNSLAFWLKTLTPVTSDGSRSGVNWRRENEQSSERASAFASIVFPTPGKSSMIRCPSATRQSTTSRSVSAGACTTERRLRTTAAMASAGTSSGACSGVVANDPLDLVQHDRCDLLLRRLRNAPLSPSRYEHDLVLGCVEADIRARDVVEHDHVGVLAFELLPRPFEPVRAVIGREADDHLVGAASLADCREDVGRRLQLDRPRARVLGTLRGVDL